MLTWIALCPNNAVALDPLEQLIQRQQWYQLGQWLQDQGDNLNLVHGQRLQAGLRQHANKYDAVAMRRLLRIYLQFQPDDVEARFLLSDMQLLEGLADAALESLLDILRVHHDAAVNQRARTEADRIIQTIVATLQARGALGELESFWRHVSARYSASDAYRYQWARSLFELRRFEEAAGVLAETGSQDISQATLDEFATAIAKGVHRTRIYSPWGSTGCASNGWFGVFSGSVGRYRSKRHQPVATRSG